MECLDCVIAGFAPRLASLSQSRSPLHGQESTASSSPSPPVLTSLPPPPAAVAVRLAHVGQFLSFPACVHGLTLFHFPFPKTFPARAVILPNRLSIISFSVLLMSVVTL